jgi:hypothetical protein
MCPDPEVPIHPVEQRCDPPEFQQLVPLEPLGQLDRVVLVVCLEAASERHVILLLD